MNLDFSEVRNVKVSMIPYLNEFFRDFPELLGDIVTSPAADHFFNRIPGMDAYVRPFFVPTRGTNSSIYIHTRRYGIFIIKRFVFV